MTTIVDDEEKGKSIYMNFWFGQYGTYKVSERGRLNKLDIYETLFLIDKGVLKVKNYTRKQILDIAEKRRSDFLKLYQVYADWRSKGYVIKTGFKFGTHFRVYFPGAKPVKADERQLLDTLEARDTRLPEGRKAAHIGVGQGHKGRAFGQEDLHTRDTREEQEEGPCNRLRALPQKGRGIETPNR